MSKVSRSVYQKLSEENKSLKRDIKKLVIKKSIPEFIITFSKWEKHFKKEDEFNSMMKIYAQQYRRNNPNDPVVKALNEIEKESGISNY